MGVYHQIPRGLIGGGNLAGTFANYTAPLSSEFGALSINNVITLAASDTFTLYNDGAGTNLGFNLSDVTLGYFVLAWNSGAIFVTGGDASGRQAVYIQEGDTASTVAGGGTLFTNSAYRHTTTTGPINYVESFFGSGRPTSGSSEFGLHASDSSTTTPRSRVHGATLMALPLLDSSFVGSTLGEQDNTWSTSSIGAINCDSQIAGDENQTISGTFTVGKLGTYLVLTRVRPQSTSATAARSLRWTHQIDGVDIFSVCTNTATAGATRTGRGFQMQMPAAININPYFTSAQVMTLDAGVHTFSAVGNRHESADNGEIINNNALFVVNTSMFKQFKYVQVTTTQTALTGATWSAHNAFSQTITLNGQAKVWLIFSTTSHQNTSSGVLAIRIKRNGTVITPQGVDAGSQPYPQNAGYAVLNGTNGTADSDNDTLPYCIHWVDNPGAGTWTYTIESADQGATSNALWNTNDNGAAGFKGLFAIAELSFATVGF